MEIKPLTERQKTLIVNNVIKACNDIEKLNRTGYKYLYLCSGFIAHHNLYGFIQNFRDGSLKSAILRNHSPNQWKNFRAGDQNYDYYMSKADVYNQIVSRLLDTA